MFRSRCLVLSLVVCLVSLPLSAGAAWAEHHEGGTVVVHLSKFSNDLHAVNMALKLGTALLQSGSKVTLFVDLEGVRLADARQPQNLRWGETKPIGELYKEFTAAGGRVLVCPHCAAAAGLDAKSLRPGAELGTTKTIAKLLKEASKILDY